MSEATKPLVDPAALASVHPQGRAETFQGNPCKRGHSGLRYRKGGACVECSRDQAKAKKAKPV